MIKYFHELTKEEYEENIAGMTYKEGDEKYPQPPWCAYPDAIHGMMGCWSLVGFMVTGEDYCKDCDMYQGGSPKNNSAQEGHDDQGKPILSSI